MRAWGGRGGGAAQRPNSWQELLLIPTRLCKGVTDSLQINFLGGGREIRLSDCLYVLALGTQFSPAIGELGWWWAGSYHVASERLAVPGEGAG